VNCLKKTYDDLTQKLDIVEERLGKRKFLTKSKIFFDSKLPIALKVCIFYYKITQNISKVILG
jgi:hypothetical protein